MLSVLVGAVAAGAVVPAVDVPAVVAPGTDDAWHRAGIVVVGATWPASTAPSAGSSDDHGGISWSASFGREVDPEHHAVVVDVDAIHVGDVAAAGVGVGVAVPHLDRQLGVLAVALRLAFLVLVG